MAVDYGYILSFDNSSGLPPQVVAKLNNNFRHLAGLFSDPEIVMAAGATFPDPRTEETLFYKTDTGELYIWARFQPIDPDTYQPQAPYWDWMKLDADSVSIVSAPPANPYIRDDNNVIKYVLTQNMAMPYFYIYDGSVGPGWYSLFDIIEFRILDWWGDQNNIALVKSLLGLT